MTRKRKGWRVLTEERLAGRVYRQPARTISITNDDASLTIWLCEPPTLFDWPAQIAATSLTATQAILMLWERWGIDARTDPCEKH